jgi:hypothetical protein
VAGGGGGLRGFSAAARDAFRDRAEVAEFYGFDPTGLSPWELEGYLRNIPRLEARRARRELTFRPDLRLTVEQMRRLVLAETDSEAAADEAAAAYMAALLRAGETPE